MKKKNGVVSFFVDGRPRPGGSKNAFLHPATKRLIVTDAGGKPTAEWKKDIKLEAREHFPFPFRGAVAVVVYFEILRPKNHYRTGKNAGKLKPNAPNHPTKRPDTTKLWRPAEDALTGIAWVDDSQVVSQLCVKRYSDRQGMEIHIEEISDDSRF